MNKKGAEMNVVGTLIVVFIGVIVGVALILGGMSSSVGQLTQTNTIVNDSITFPLVGSYVTLKGQAAYNVVVVNNTGGVIDSGNYTVSNYVLSNGQLVTRLTAVGGGWFNGSIGNVSYTSEPYGYDTNAGSRAVETLIIVFAALAVAIFALVPVLRNGVLDLFDI